MNSTQVPSLEQTALVKITAMLWTQNDIRTIIGNCIYSRANQVTLKEWQKIENHVVAIVPKLLPVTFKYKILCLIKPVGLQLLFWMTSWRNLSLKSLLDNLFWTNRGTIDRKKSASALIKDNSLDITVRYKLACIFCLENDILQLWNKMSPKNKKSFYWENSQEYINKEDFLVVFWTKYLEKVAKSTKLYTKCGNAIPYGFAFERAVLKGHIEAVKYFLPKLTLLERERSLFEGAKCLAMTGCLPMTATYSILFKERDAEVLCYLLSQMNVEQQMRVYQTHSYEVLTCMLEWPCQDVFLGTSDMFWKFLRGDIYNLILCEIINKVEMGYRDYNYKKLFRMFWERSPDALKKSVINNCNNSRSCLSKLFKVYDKENIRLILKDVTVAVREEIIFHNNGKTICESLIDHDKWDFLKFFVQECISSKGSMIKFKEEFKKHSCLLGEAVKKEEKWNKFFQLLDDLIPDDRKRRIEDGGSCPAKKLCK